MAERIENIMARGSMDVEHKGDTVHIKMPSWFNVPQDVWYDEEKLVEWLTEQGILLATLHKGFEQHIIDIRSKARPKDLKPLEKGGKPRPQKIEQADAEARALEYKPEPRQPQADPVKKAADILKGLSPEQIAQLKEQGLI
jgi:hypothetical protein